MRSSLGKMKISLSGEEISEGRQRGFTECKNLFDEERAPSNTKAEKVSNEKSKD